MRIGHGYDVHKLVEGRELILGGVNIPNSKGLLGHSDADVLIHAIIDSLLGAVALGDIGKLFPDTDDEFKDADSQVLLKVVVKRLKDCNYLVNNIDSTIIAQGPKLSSYIEQMRFNIAQCCSVDVDKINVKATTEEHLGFTGSGDGISSHAVCTVVEI